MLDGSYRGFEVVTHAPGISVVTFNEPDRLNAMGGGMKRDLNEILLQAQVDSDVRVVVLTGTGSAFCAGDDIVGLRDPARALPTLVPERRYGRGHSQVDQVGSLRTYAQPPIRTLWMLDKPTIAAVNGVAIQLGMSLVLGCDFRIAAAKARIGSATLRFGFLPDEGGHWLLLHYLGLPEATDFLLRSRIVDAERARHLGLFSEVVEPADLMGRALELADELANGPQVSMRMLKRALRNAAAATFDAACEDIATKTAVSDQHPDSREGVAAWREKRRPRFNQWLEGDGMGDRPHWQGAAEDGDSSHAPESN